MSETTHIIKRWLATRPWQDVVLSRVLESQRRIHNAIVKHIQPKLDEMMDDPRYAKILDVYIDAAKALGNSPGDEKLDGVRKAHGREMNTLMREYGLREQDLQKFANDLRKRSYQGRLNSDIVQKEATRVYAGVKKVVVADGIEHLVQRDLYSAFLGYHIVLADGKSDHVDLEACKDDFSNFLECQAAVVSKMRETGDATGNFGLSDFR